MTHHTKLRLEEREFLAEKLAAGWSQARIAKALGRSGSTVMSFNATDPAAGDHQRAGPIRRLGTIKGAGAADDAD